ncbi:FeoA family protein [Robiginitomaculum antarcticum]|uniref:FeoA family protein n=1 Tax=Robiginitomaculum antarcticum TaxID=437507 RepID=UPI0003A9ED4C|nr:FeoA family protein [Robiginitomaculum antarcticum]
MPDAQTLDTLKKNIVARITTIESVEAGVETRLREIGFAEGDEVEALHFGLFGRNPMSVRLNGALIAMRRREAACIFVSPIHG